MPILSVQNLTKTYFVHEQERLVSTFKNLSFEVCAGESVVLSGPSGVGKSSILNCIYRTCLSDTGKILFTQRDQDQVDLIQLPDAGMLALRKSGDIGFVTQFLHSLPRKSSLEVVAQPLLKQGWKKEEALDAAADQLKLFMLRESLWNLSPSTFSGGERQRVNLARGMILQPRLLLLDEPTASLDQATSVKVMEHIMEVIKTQKMAVLSIFHDIDMIENFSDKVITVS